MGTDDSLVSVATIRCDSRLAAPSIPDTDLCASIEAHDRHTADTRLWMGAEPTFTDRASEAREWLSDALGEDKEARARELARRLHELHPGSVVLRPLGRQYPDEPEPRFCYGVYARRDGHAIWSGPPDRLRDAAPNVGAKGAVQPVEAAAAARLRDALCDALAADGWFASACKVDPPAAPRLVCRPDGRPVCCDPSEEPRLGRPSVHGRRIEGAGEVDALAADGSLLVLVHAQCAASVTDGGPNAAWVELPTFGSVSDFERFLVQLGAACTHAGIDSLGIRGFNPPVDDTVAWTTVTPDPAVIEINQAPEATLRAFHESSVRLFSLAAEVGLSPYRLQYNGDVSDSGGGGQVTFGGPSPDASPFFVHPQLLPRLIRYVIRHPSLSYWFATHYVGSSSQSPRADEGVRGSFLELRVALEQLASCEAPTPDILWGTLRHFLADASGNPHRSELNIEKLANPVLPGRGQLGLVELRALSMARSVGDATARAMLFRAIVAMLVDSDRVPRLSDWGDTLHDRFALPFYLRRDLREVFDDLRACGLALGTAIEAALLAREGADLAAIEIADVTIRLERAIEFWPLVGDVASQDRGGSRIVDASTARLEVVIEGQAPGAAVEGVEISANGCSLPMRVESHAGGMVRVLGVRFRSFVPWTGVHPSMPAQQPVVLQIRPPDGPVAQVTIHGWRPAGGPYPGLPDDFDDARARRLERAVVELLDPASAAPTAPPPRAVTPYCLDLRRL